MGGFPASHVTLRRNPPQQNTPSLDLFKACRMAECQKGWFERAQQSYFTRSNDKQRLKWDFQDVSSIYYISIDISNYIYTSWWLNHPVLKICSSTWIISPFVGGENTKYLSCHHLAASSLRITACHFPAFRSVEICIHLQVCGPLKSAGFGPLQVLFCLGRDLWSVWKNSRICMWNTAVFVEV